MEETITGPVEPDFARGVVDKRPSSINVILPGEGYIANRNGS